MKKLQATFFFVFLIGCSSNQAIYPTATSNIIQTPGPFLTEPILPPIQTLTPASTFTPTHTALPTWTPLPTIEPDKGFQTLYEWFEGTEDCRLPCWAGITPGETNWEYAKQLIGATNGFLNLRTFLDETCTFGKCNEIAWSLHLDPHGYIYSVLPENEIHALIIEISTPEFLNALSLQKVLSDYGKPAILLFSTEPDLPNYDSLELILVYPERRFIIKYAKHAEITEEKVESCGIDTHIKLVVVDNQEQLASLDAIAQAVETKDFHVDVWHKSVEEAAGMTIDQFYETYRSADAPCISTPTKLWIP